ncbi:hypothetical protein SCBWM1_gp101 [Synechococcus phage S-CBWM1]|uniref:Uncharacterized protein n=1 Tax=Synechococcus phage S-CBWM1 TaxID=2053653 RepID=A0A3G1L3M2_9CAUD|nr:hypothetical protein HOU61_gp096 [Synechococcus phage S-CBWM1]ATW62785.1 hypothetical protein SCBWM1_gp101 [Synechococcus phage S-CBWM1]
MSARLDTVERLEQVLCQALIYSPLIPSAVNVFNIGQKAELDSIVNNSSNIIVNYGGSSSRQVQKLPPIYDKVLRFELIFKCQNYLTNSAHSFATYLMAAASTTITGLTPNVDGLSVSQPFNCVSENPIELTEESEFVYSQVYELEVQEIMPVISLDPCVLKGDCGYLFPSANTYTKIPLAGVFDPETGEIFVPEYTGNSPNPNIPENSGVQWSDQNTMSGNWVFQTDTDTVFLANPLGSHISLISTGAYTEDGRLSVAVKDSETGAILNEVFYVGTGKKLARYALEMWNNGPSAGGRGMINSAVTKDSSTQSLITYGEFAVVNGSFTFLYADPLVPDVGKRQTLEGGNFIGVLPDVFLSTGAGKFFLVPQSPKGRGWIKEGTFSFVESNSLWKMGCQSC